MRSFRLPLLLLIVGIVAIALVVAQLVAPRVNDRLDAGRSYVEGVAGAPQAINPLLCQLNEADRDLCGLVFSGLARLNEAGEAVPDLASTWAISEDGITYTFKLRPDARWHDDKPVTADDVLFTASLLQAPEFPGRSDIGAAWQSLTVARLDDITVRFVLREPFAGFLDYVTIGLLPRHVLSGTEARTLAQAQFNLQPVGSGPWRVVDVSAAGSRVSAVALEPFAGYYGSKPALARLTFRYYANTSATLDAFQAGEVDGVARVAVVDQTRAAALPGLTLYTAKLARYSALFLNTRKDSGTVALADKQVRQALLYALDREKIVRDALAGQGVVADTPFIPDTWAYSDSTRKYSFDPERARQLLRSAGYELATDPRSNQPFWLKDGEAIALTLLHADDPTRKAVAEAVVTQWRALGIQVVAQAVGRNLERDYLASRQFQVALVEVPLDGDPDQYTFWHHSQAVRGQNYTGYDSNEAGDFLEAARQTTDKGRRAELYRRFQDLFTEDLPALPLYYPTYTFGVTSRIRGAQVGPLNYGSDRLRSVGDWIVAPAIPAAPAQPAATPTR